MHLKNVLPEEIILQIFSEIERNDLRNLLEISKEWRNLLLRNVKVMRKLPLVLMNDTWSEKIEFVENYGKYIRKVEFMETNLESFEDVLKVLRLTPNIEKLSLINVKLADKEIDEGDDQNDETISPEKLILKRLEEVILKDDENVGSMKFVALKCDAKLRSLKCDLIHQEQLPFIEQLLTENHHLKALEIATSLDEVFNPKDEVIEGFQLRLSELKIKATVMKYSEQFYKFLKSQSSLKELGLIGSYVDFRYHQMMFTTFPSVRNIHLNIDALGTTDCLMKLRTIPPNKSLESLTLLGKNKHLNIFDSVLKLSPRVSELNVHSLAHFYSDKIKALPLTHLLTDCVNREYLMPECMTYLSKLQFTDITRFHKKEIYERNLQNFCDLSEGFSDKPKDMIKAF